MPIYVQNIDKEVTLHECCFRNLLLSGLCIAIPIVSVVHKNMDSPPKNLQFNVNQSCPVSEQPGVTQREFIGILPPSCSIQQAFPPRLCCTALRRQPRRPKLWTLPHGPCSTALSLSWSQKRKGEPGDPGSSSCNVGDWGLDRSPHPLRDVGDPDISYLFRCTACQWSE